MGRELRVSEYIKSLYIDNTNVKILHYNTKTDLLKNELAHSGFDNYLGVTTKKLKSGAESGLFYVNDKGITYKNNADVLIMNKADLYDVKNALSSSAELIVFKPNHAFNYASFVSLLAYKLARKKKWTFNYKALVDEHGKKSTWVVLERKHKKEMKARHYLSPDISLEGFFKVLNNYGLQYVILRWYDKLPFSDISEDVDLLVSDEDVEVVQQLINEKVGILPFDIYSVSGLPGSDFKNIAYYPPYLAERILNGRRLWKEKFFVPGKKDYLLSLMYHAVYHKGEKSGIPISQDKLARNDLADHEYLVILQQLARENDMDLKEQNLLYFHNFLKEQGWAPATDTIRKLSGTSGSWLETTIQDNESNFHKNGELMVFVVREWAAERGKTDYIVDWFEKAGLNTVMKVELDEEQKRKAAQNLRGGNWERGPWPVSGGKPSALLVMYDYHPRALNANMKKRYPHVSNELYLLKEKLREEMNAPLSKEERTNPIHSADDEIEAFDYITAVVPEVLGEVKETITKWDADYVTKERVIADISENKRRAKVEVIEYNGQKAVKKTYKADKERFLNREKYVYGELSKECEFIPKLLDSGENYIITPYLQTLKFTENHHIKKQLLKKYRKEIFSISEFFYNKGYALIDFHPGNLLITKEGLKVIDFEFLYQYENIPKSSRESFDLMGFPDDFVEDRPYGIEGRQRRNLWKKILY
ncbi:hypothetical protein [Planococcus salinus]|uniref:Protein kinase domain-containing protein n=1 Tax=Planococcus salinus TaxID=1848460 RepID=A0A3M8P7X1_9BACL|nr:hypothetical protein [Planococcus salinus]RNF39521.1 hypothetical protein EEX84_08580 [Planococcus salinus]